MESESHESDHGITVVMTGGAGEQRVVESRKWPCTVCKKGVGSI